MKFTLSWLQDHLDTDWSASAIAEKLTDIGLELEELVDNQALFAPFVIARIEEVTQHPNAERLRVCTVNTGTQTHQVVCGAPNATKGLTGVFAPPDSFIPGTGLQLKTSAIRGVVSEGMLVSERELCISDAHDGIIDLGAIDVPLGTPYGAYVGLDDPVFDIAITPNRGDCLGVRGIARDLAAAGAGQLKPFAIPQIQGTYPTPIEWQRSDDIGEDCPYVTGRHVRGVKNGPSPGWMQQRLNAIGLRPISTLVDITNYVTHDLGRPLHVFDADKLSGNLVIRKAQDGEKLLALDGKTYPLTPSMTVIADDKSVQSIGGVMGGEDSGCGDATTNIFIESALFDAINVANTGRALDLQSDARYRFERGMDPSSADMGVSVATQWINRLCGGTPSHVTFAGNVPNTARSVTLRLSRLRALGGVDVPGARVTEILQSLGFSPTKITKTEITLDIPGWRTDISAEHCLVEEVLRIYGFDKVPSVSLPRDHALPTQSLTPMQQRIGILRRKMASIGLWETVTWSFIDAASCDLFGGTNPQLQLQNPIHAELAHMRPSLLPNLLSAARNNRDRAQGNLGLFEIGPVFYGTDPQDQQTQLGIMRMGKFTHKQWHGEGRDVDVFDSKRDCEIALAHCEVSVQNLL
ncbi:MAG: phenylalanine--tRNA ligase subunit beta, partial [Pseudomonadota bacterium]